MTLLLGLAVLVVVLWVVGRLSRADPKGVAKGARIAGGVAALGGAAFLVARGQMGIGIPLGLTGLGLLGWLPFGGARQPFISPPRRRWPRTSWHRSTAS